MSRHYLDHASTSPLRPEVLRAMVRSLEELGTVSADPGRVHSEGRIARHALEEAREKVASFLEVRPRQVVFTSGATESVNTAVWGATRAHPGRAIALAGVEHSSVRDSSERLAPTVALEVDRLGRILTGSVEAALRDAEGSGGLALVHCQAANHEVGTIQGVADVVELCRDWGVLVHVDAATACGHLELDLDSLGADLVSISAHKFGGPPGIGALVVRRGLRLDPFLAGGEQERGRRAGFENIPSAVGFGAAAELLSEPPRLAGEVAMQRRLSESIAKSATAVDGVHLLGDPVGVPQIVAVSIDGVEAEPVLLALDRAGIAAHSGSSCASESLAPSPVLEAMGVDADRSLRLSVGWSSTEDDVRAFAEAFGPAVQALRDLRP
jgi:cysteine desulfurase